MEICPPRLVVFVFLGVFQFGVVKDTPAFFFWQRRKHAIFPRRQTIQATEHLSRGQAERRRDVQLGQIANHFRKNSLQNDVVVMNVLVARLLCLLCLLTATTAASEFLSFRLRAFFLWFNSVSDGVLRFSYNSIFIAVFLSSIITVINSSNSTVINSTNSTVICVIRLTVTVT